MIKQKQDKVYCDICGFEIRKSFFGREIYCHKNGKKYCWICYHKKMEYKNDKTK